MKPVSADWQERARKIEAMLLRGLAAIGLNAVAEALGVDPSTVSRMKQKEIPQLAVFLAMAGYKVVPIDMHCFRRDDIEALLTLARSRLQLIAHADELAEDDA